MTLIELHEFLGNQLKKVENSENCPRETQQKILDTAMVEAAIAKQIIQNADIILRTDKLKLTGKASSNVIDTLIR